MKRRSYKQFMNSCKIKTVSPRVRKRTDHKYVQQHAVLEHDGINVDQNEPMIEDVPENDNIDVLEPNIPLNVNNLVTENLQSLDESAISSIGIMEANEVTINENEVRCLFSEYDQVEPELLNDLRDLRKNQTSLCKTKNLEEFRNHPNLLNPVLSALDKSPGEIFIMTLEHCMKFNSFFSQLCSTIQLVNNMFKESILPDTRYRLDNILNPKDNVEYHGICPKCCKYVGKIANFGDFVICTECSETIDLSNPSSSNIFVLINPSRSIQQILKENEDYYDYIVNNRQYNGRIKDIFDGKSYRSFVRKLPINERNSYLTAVFNTDGAPRFESSNFSAWPIYLQLNEIPLEIRFKRIIPVGIWFGRHKPEMSSFLKPFQILMNTLSSEGIPCTIKNELRNIKLYCLTCSVDSVARAPIQGTKQFNGKYGCNWCLHEGEFLEGSMRYPVVDPYPGKRTAANMTSFMQKLVDDELDDVYGVTTVSPLNNLKYYDIVKGFTPEYMHSCLLGVSKHITNLILNTITNEQKEKLNEMILKIKIPHQLQRLTRSFKDVNDWKAREWQNWTLYYSLPLYNFIQLPSRLFNYWKLFVDSLFTLLQTEITIEELDKVDENLHRFVFLTQTYFGKPAVTFNVHILLHLMKSVLNWGPLWCHSTFPFEAANHNLLNAIHCAKGVNLQIVRYMNIQQAITILESTIFPHASRIVIDYCKELTVKRIKKSLKLSFVTYLGSEKLANTEIIQFLGLTENNTFKYDRAVINSCLFASSERRNLRSDNSYAQLLDGTFIRIMYFFVDKSKNEEVTLCKIINTSISVTPFTHQIRSIGNEVIKIDTSKIAKICVYVDNDNNSRFILTMPNSLQY